MVKTIAIVSLSDGIIGEDFVAHEIKIGIKRLEDYGIKVKFMKNSLNGIDYLKKYPQKRAEDLLQAFSDPEIDMILCAIGGDDTYRLLPYLFENEELRKVSSQKIFLGFSDSTMNHFMLHKVGINTFYGQSFLTDICELADSMLPYTKSYFEELLSSGKISKITPSAYWYEGRTDFGIEQIGTKLKKHENQGFQLLRGKPVFSGKILGGCLDSIYDIFDGKRYSDSPLLCKKYHLFPELEEWNDKILLLETSEEKMSPEKYRKALIYLRNEGIFSRINGLLVGKPMDEVYFEEYKEILLDVIDNEKLSIVYNINIGHALPRCIVPFGVEALVDIGKQEIVFQY